MDKFLSANIGILISFLSYLFGTFDNGTETLFVFICIDFITAVFVGFCNKSKNTADGGLSSKVFFLGVCKKFGVIPMYIIVGHFLDIYLGIDFVKNAVVIAFITSELISITENCALIGVPIPGQITKCIEVLKEKGDYDD